MKQVKKLVKFLRQRKYLVLALVVLVAFVGVRAASKKTSEAEELVDLKTVVSTKIIEPTDTITSTLRLSGELKPKQETVIRSLVQGDVLALTPVGTRVNKNDQLFVLSNSTIETSYNASLSDYNSAQQNFEQKKFISQESVVQAELNLNSAEANLNLAQDSLTNTIQSNAQNHEFAVGSAIVGYDSAYNAMQQAIVFLGGDNENSQFAYKNALNANQQGFINAEIAYLDAKRAYLDLPQFANRDDIENSLKLAKSVMAEVNKAVNLTTTLTNYLIPNSSLSQSSIDSDKSLLATYKAQLTTAESGINNAVFNLNSTKIKNVSTLRQAETQLQNAEIQYNNALSALESAKRSANLQVSGAQTELNLVSSQFAQADYNFDSLSLEAPFSGVVIAHYVEIGDQVSPGNSIVQIGEIDGIEIQVDVDNSDAQSLSLGQLVVIDDDKSGFISEIEPVAANQTGKVKVTIESDNDDHSFAIGRIVTVQIDLARQGEDLIVVPLKSIQIGQNESFVYIVENGKVAKRTVELGEVFGLQVVVKDGLSQGDEFILRNGEFISEGEAVETILSVE
ncbi:MAG: hypothetical protein COT81_04845 [Candidatus Buchananbacteria bacterium CG10_big_fil_rev_8_21_14_0_10_42_9]|uniref:YknX-like C-terminal permuted SH3-like domain-containing protein n=1 Tax=Candidatus Buchananbacteria bacterium CG10_big_fil_rev_8_21_14_0_10_42_9 TaxID=1974526 RepID=A0A2H0W047_9BACT|nr:MAG: hypothetical protein COT81_04845 [Candidatus Buchananbacteria bacterium CG10_big_fil_rev_8_21_14_0_10_42_9]